MQESARWELMVNTPESQWAILDCSLRDGGYLNDWSFPLELAKAHVAGLATLGVTMVEIGFRSASSTSSAYLGQFAHTEPALLAELQSLGTGAQLGVMVNQSDFPEAQLLLDRFELLSEQEPRPFVRVATHPYSLDEALELARVLLDNGFPTFLNLMQVHTVPPNDFPRIAEKASGLTLSALYVADSLGALRPTQVAELVGSLVSCARVPIGVHFHNNLGLAFANSLAAVAAGARFVDGTALGIGRGAGNTKLEELLLEHPSGPSARDISWLVELWKDWVLNAEEVTPWGPSLEYALAAKNNVHPTFVQKMLEDESFSAAEQITAIEELGTKSASHFSEDLLKIGNDWFVSPGSTSSGVGDLFKGEHLLLLGSGPSVERFLPEITRTIETLGLVVCIVGAGMPEVKADYRIISQPTSVISRPEALETDAINIGPFGQFVGRLSTDVPRSGDLSIDLVLSESDFGFDGERVFSSSSRSSVVALALLSGLAPASILIAGFDGFPPGDGRNHEFAESLRRVQQAGKSITSVTPTAFEIGFRGFA